MGLGGKVNNRGRIRLSARVGKGGSVGTGELYLFN